MAEFQEIWVAQLKMASELVEKSGAVFKLGEKYRGQEDRTKWLEEYKKYFDQAYEIVKRY